MRQDEMLQACVEDPWKKPPGLVGSSPCVGVHQCLLLLLLLLLTVLLQPVHPLKVEPRRLLPVYPLTHEMKDPPIS